MLKSKTILKSVALAAVASAGLVALSASAEACSCRPRHRHHARAVSYEVVEVVPTYATTYAYTAAPANTGFLGGIFGGPEIVAPVAPVAAPVVMENVYYRY